MGEGTGNKKPWDIKVPAMEVVDESIPWHWHRWSAWSEVKRNEIINMDAVDNIKRKGLDSTYRPVPRVEIIQHRHCVICQRLESRKVKEDPLDK